MPVIVSYFRQDTDSANRLDSEASVSEPAIHNNRHEYPAFHRLPFPAGCKPAFSVWIFSKCTQQRETNLQRALSTQADYGRCREPIPVLAQKFCRQHCCFGPVDWTVAFGRCCLGNGDSCRWQSSGLAQRSR